MFKDASEDADHLANRLRAHAGGCCHRCRSDSSRSLSYRSWFSGQTTIARVVAEKRTCILTPSAGIVSAPEPGPRRLLVVLNPFVRSRPRPSRVSVSCGISRVEELCLPLLLSFSPSDSALPKPRCAAGELVENVKNPTSERHD
jgi:hypothetical protein